MVIRNVVEGEILLYDNTCVKVAKVVSIFKVYCEYTHKNWRGKYPSIGVIDTFFLDTIPGSEDTPVFNISDIIIHSIPKVSDETPTKESSIKEDTNLNKRNYINFNFEF